MTKTILYLCNYSLDKSFFIRCVFSVQLLRLFVQLELQEHVVTIALMPLAESRDNIFIRTSVYKSIYPLRSLSRDWGE